MTQEFVTLPRDVVEQALKVLEYAANDVLTGRNAATALRAALEQHVEQEPVTAQQRFRHPQKTMPDWSAWQPCGIANRPAWKIDSQGYEVEYRALYTHPQHKHEPLTDEQIEKICPLFDDPMRREMWKIGFKVAHNIK